MEPFTYTDIFATKGMEYLVVIAFLVLMIPFWIVLNRPWRATGRMREAVSTLTAGFLRLMPGLLYSRGHAWTFLERTGTARVGLDDFLLQVTGPISIKEIMPKGTILEKGDLMATIGQNGKSLRVYAPISGEVVETNPEGALAHDDPYRKGWIYGIRPSRWKEETGILMMAEEASGWWKNELERLRDFFAASLSRHSPVPTMVALQEGGELRPGPLAEMHEAIWQDFQEEFLEE